MNQSVLQNRSMLSCESLLESVVFGRVHRAMWSRASRPQPHNHLVTRSFTRITNFSPDQTSFTAQTFTSTSPAGRPILITSFSPKSVTMPEAFLGQLTHSIPAGASRRANFGNCCLHLRLALDEDHGEVELFRTRHLLPTGNRRELLSIPFLRRWAAGKMRLEIVV